MPKSLETTYNRAIEGQLLLRKSNRAVFTTAPRLLFDASKKLTTDRSNCSIRNKEGIETKSHTKHHKLF